MRRYWLLAAFGFACLAAAAVWLGGLNQDEGWYLYAARMVHEGFVPYRDYMFTQGPVMPTAYSLFPAIWNGWGILGGRLVTLAIGLVALGFFAATAAALVPRGRRAAASVVTFLLLGCNLYHVYYVTIPKTYALASLFVAIGFFLVALGARAMPSRRGATWGQVAVLFVAGVSLALAAGTRISLGALLAAVGFGLLFACRRLGGRFVWFGLGGALGLTLVYGPFLLDAGAREGLLAAQRYHAARGGFDPVFAVGSLSRLVRWYLPLFLLFGLGVAGFLRRREASAATGGFDLFGTALVLAGFLAVFAVQIFAPFPYEDYQVPVMGLAAVVASVLAVSARGAGRFVPLLALGASWACSFGSPLLEKWTMNGQDRFWSLKKDSSELAQLREVARRIEQLDPGGTELLTQDTYLAIETGRRVPRGLEMGPFSELDDAGWRALLENTTAPVAALSGYTFAVEPPVCAMRPLDQQFAYWEILRKRYSLADRVEYFGQNATTLMILRRDEEGRR